MTPVNFSRELAVRDDAFWRIMDVIVPYSDTEYSDILPGCPECAGRWDSRTVPGLCSSPISLISVMYSPTSSFQTDNLRLVSRGFSSREVARYHPNSAPRLAERILSVLRTDDWCAPVAPRASTANARNNPKQRTFLVPRLHGRVTSQPDEDRGHQSLRGRNED